MSLRVVIALAALAVLVRAQAPEEAAAPGEALTPSDTTIEVELVGLNGAGHLVYHRPVDGARMVWIPAGTFQQNHYHGMATDEPEWDEVHVDGFAIDLTEVTAAQVARFLRAHEVGADGLGDDGQRWIVPVEGGLEYARWRDGAEWRPRWGCDRLPALGVTGHGALRYARWVGGDLPRHAEWQKAASGSEGRTFPWGEEPPTPRLARYRAPGHEDDLQPLAVGSLPAGASPYGVLDMAGNAYERVWTRRRGGEELPVMIRGGSWASPNPLNLRTWDLCMQPMGVGDRTVGFRCVVRRAPGLPQSEDEARELVARLREAPTVEPTLRLATSWESAVAEARQRNVPILASLQYETCGQSDRTKVQLFRDPALIDYVNEHAVCVIGQWPHDALDEPHSPGEDGSCPLWKGLTCKEHHELFAALLARVKRFSVSPATFVLDPHAPEDAPRDEHILVDERHLPKWGGGAHAVIAALEAAQEKLGKATPPGAWEDR